MQIEFFNITTYQGISCDAEHFYAKHENASYFEEMLWSTDRLQELKGSTGNDFRYIPSKEEAEQIAKKDYPDRDRTLTPEQREEYRETTVGDLLEYGTARFPSILRIIQEARSRYPDAVLYFTLFGSRKEFVKWCSADKSRFEKIVKLLTPDKKS